MRAGVTTMAVVLPVFWSMAQLRSWYAVPLDAVVFAVVVAVALPRGLARVRPADLPAGLGALVAGAAAALGCGVLLGFDDWRRALGAAAFTVGVAVPVWLRRFGPAWRSVGVLAALPFTAILVHPLPFEAGRAFAGWMLVATGVAAVWACALYVAGPPPSPPSSAQRTSASTRMACQLAVATPAAFAVAQWLDPDHLVWPVLTVLVVHSGNRGRGDVVWKGTQRTLGALAGTAVATACTGSFGAGDDVAIVLVFAIIAVAAALRSFGYALWAAGITAALAFLYGYFGQSGADLLAHRLGGVLAGGVLGVLAGWFVLPVRTTDVARLRLSGLLAATTDLGAALARGEQAAALRTRLLDADRELAPLVPTVRAARHFGLRALAGKIDDARALARSLLAHTRDVTVAADRAAAGALAREAGVVRRSLAK